MKIETIFITLNANYYNYLFQLQLKISRECLIYQGLVLALVNRLIQYLIIYMENLSKYYSKSMGLGFVQLVHFLQVSILKGKL